MKQTVLDLSIIIVSYNTCEYTKRCLTAINNSLTGSSIRWEVIVIDNNSQDGSVQMIEASFPDVVLIKNTINVGFGRANNQGVEASSGTYVLFLNSDCFVLEDGIETLFTFVHSKYEVGEKIFAGGKLFNEDSSEQASCGPFYTLPVVGAMLFFKGDTLHITRYSPRKIQSVDWISGACMLTKKEDIESMGGFDESIFMYMEEIDLLYRAKKQHHMSVFFYPDAQFTHLGAASSGSKKEPVVNIYRGLKIFYQKHYGSYQYYVLIFLLTLKAWLVILICGIMGNQELKKLYAKALAALE